LIVGYKQSWVEYANWLEVTLKSAHKDIIAVEKQRNALEVEVAKLAKAYEALIKEQCLSGGE
jgi:hypothetical protein